MPSLLGGAVKMQGHCVLTFIEPVFDGSAEGHHRWSPDAHSWS